MLIYLFYIVIDTFVKIIFFNFYVCILCKFTQSFGNIMDNVGNVINILNTIITYLTLLMFIVKKRNTYILKVLIFLFLFCFFVS
jgi:hypothetical protein